MARSFTAILAVVLAATSSVRSFSIQSASFSSSNKQVLSRRDWITTALVAGSVVLTPLAANADVTTTSSALRGVKRSLKQLDSLELYVTSDNYEELKAALRTAPLADIRKNMSTLVRRGEDGPNGDALASAYNKFIQVLEGMDSTAGLAMRGRNIPAEEFYGKYKATVAALNDFLKVAEESAGVTLVEESS